jgi:glycosyltransferase involved in cell wall biosynthesis
MKISVVMGVTLDSFKYICDNGFIVTSATNREEKFKRAVQSFLDQTYKNKELIIVADGCPRVGEVVSENYENPWRYGLIRLRNIEKQMVFSGEVRQTGIDIARGSIICFLDSDDYLGKEHLKTIVDNFNPQEYDWCYYNDFLVRDINRPASYERNTQPVAAKIGTSSIAFKRGIEFQFLSGSGHDWRSIDKYLLSLKGIKIKTPAYFVCHCSQLGIDV